MMPPLHITERIWLRLNPPPKFLAAWRGLTDMKAQGSQEKKINGWRIFFSIFHFVLPIVLTWWLADKIFYLNERQDIESMYRFLWCLFSSMLGFSVLVFQLRYHTPSVFPDYLTYYPFLLLETVPKKSEKMLSKNLLETKSIIFSKLLKIQLK